jgi:hypothetical protein
LPVNCQRRVSQQSGGEREGAGHAREVNGRRMIAWTPSERERMEPAAHTMLDAIGYKT